MALKRGTVAGLGRRQGKLFLIKVRYWKTYDSELVWENVNARRSFYRGQVRIKAEMLLTLPFLLVTERMIRYIPLWHQLSS